MSSPSKEDVDLGDDALDELISEAENLMLNLDNAATPVMEGFSIDSDEEDDDADDDPLSSFVSASATATAAAAATDPTDTGGDARPAKAETINDHPLSMENLASAGLAPATPSGTPVPSSTSFPSLFTTSHIAAGINGVGAAGTAATMDNLKQQTSRFASGLASMAQRAANQVAAATAPTPPVHVAGGPTPRMGSNVMPPAPGPATATSSNAPTGYNPTYPAQMPNMIPPGARTTTPNGVISPPAMDKEQKEQLMRDHVGDLLPGERLIMFLTHLLHVGDTSGLSYASSQQGNDGYMWCCAMTYYRLILFSTAPSKKLQLSTPDGWNAKCWPATPAATKKIETPLASIDRVEKTVYVAAGSSYMGIVVHSKDCGRTIRFTTPSYADTGRAFDSLNTYAFPGRRNLGYLFAFESKRQPVMASLQVDATTGKQTITLPPTPKRFDPMIEYPRLLSRTSTTNSPWMLWASINSSYQLSPTYPSVIVGPATLDETKPESQHVIRQCAAFRAEQRLPALCWCGVGGASIWRAAQPKVGLQGNRSPADELFLRHVAESARGANAMSDPPPVYSRAMLQQLTGEYSKDWIPEPGCGLKIFDLRPRASAMANRTGGYGYENTSNYTNSTIQFCNISNIHAVRDAYQKLCSVCNSESTNDVNFYSLVEDTKWMSLLRIILAAAWETAYWVHVWRIPVLVHCSHGWDRTSQVSALAQIFLDPYYRTRHGFSVLVEKEFMSFGHPFHLRCAHGEGRNQSNTGQSANDEGQISPVFLQFLDCVYQIVTLYPSCFEFTPDYLLEFSFHIYSCRFGNLLCDSEREREVSAGIRYRTYSVWDYLDSKPEFVNKEFDGEENGGVLLMPLPTLLRNVRLWSERHCSCSPKPSVLPLNN